MKKTAIMIQARMESTRLPCKVDLPFYAKKSILDIIIEKLLFFKDQYQIVLVTGEGKKNKQLEKYAKKYNISFFQGSEKNVLKRFIDCGEKYNSKNIIRVCSDNPFIQINYIKKMLLEYNNEDYFSYKNHKKTPVIKTHLGLFVEIVKLNALKKVNDITSSSLYREHVTNYIYENESKFQIKLIKAPLEVYKRDDLRFTIDNEEDFSSAKELYKKYLQFNESITDLIRFVDSSPRGFNKIMRENIIKYNK